MKKLIYSTIICLVFLPVSLNAQLLKFGIRGGVQDNVRLKEITEDSYKIDYKTGKLGLHFGVTSQINISKIFVQPDITFSTNANAIELTDLRDGEAEIGKQRFNKLDVPIVAGLKLGKLKVGAGPVFTAHLNSKSDLLKDNGIEYTYNNATIGYQIGFGLEGKTLGLELRYEDNLSDRGTAVKIGDTSFNTDQRASQVMLTLSYYFNE